jgi:hypothetical protein
LTMPLGLIRKAVVMKKAKPKNGKHPRISECEKRIIQDMAKNREMIPADIAKTLGRDRSTIGRQLAMKNMVKQGRKECLSTDQKDKLEQVVVDMVKTADANYMVTLPMIHRRSRLKCSERTVSRALHLRGYRFFRLYEKLILTPEDIKKRWNWAKKYASKSRQWWIKNVHIHLDNKHFKAPLTSKARKLTAKRGVKGVYRKTAKKGAGKATRIHSCFVKPSPKLRTNLGSKGVLKMGGVGAGKVLVWATVEGRWSGEKAAEMYSKVVAPALKKQYPGKKRFVALEDNDPTGNRSKLGLAAKTKAKVDLLKIPERSPDLNVLDYSIWSEVERRLRHQERCMKDEKRETREEFIKRLDRTAHSLTREEINKAIGKLHKRCQLLLKAKGGLFVEGGNKRRPK